MSSDSRTSSRDILAKLQADLQSKLLKFVPINSMLQETRRELEKKVDTEKEDLKKETKKEEKREEEKSPKSETSGELIKVSEIESISLKPVCPKKPLHKKIILLAHGIRISLDGELGKLWQITSGLLGPFAENIKPQDYIKFCDVIDKQMDELTFCLLEWRKTCTEGGAPIEAAYSEIFKLSPYIKQIRELLGKIDEQLPHSYFNFFFFLVFLGLAAVSFFYLTPLLAPLLMTVIHSAIPLLLAELGIALASSGIVVLAVIGIANIIRVIKNHCGSVDDKKGAKSTNKLSLILTFLIAFIPGSVVGSYAGTSILAHLGITLSAQYTPALAFGFGFITGGAAFLVALMISLIQACLFPPRENRKEPSFLQSSFAQAIGSGLQGAFYTGMAVQIVEQALVVLGISLTACPVPLGMITILGYVIGFLIGAAIKFNENPSLKHAGVRTLFGNNSNRLSSDLDSPEHPHHATTNGGMSLSSSSSSSSYSSSA